MNPFLSQTSSDYLCSSGSNPEAANVSGVNVARTIMLVFTLAGLMYGITGFIEAARIGSNSA
ncbi:MAG: hypothetical protein IJ979_03545, partial [Tidjanibacter sp.]|nr:hypothetical protein [Tidjanibacter sp.]